MREMKYIVFESAERGKQIIAFNKTIVHAEMAEAVERMRVEVDGKWKRIFMRPTSAGFTDGESCYGRSESLNLKSREAEDAKLFK